MKESSSRSSPKYFRSPAQVKPSCTVPVRTRLAKSYSRLLPAEVGVFPHESDPRLRDRPLQTQCFRREQKCPLAPFQPSLLASQLTFPKQEPSSGDPRHPGRYGSGSYTELPVGVVKAASVNTP